MALIAYTGKPLDLSGPRPSVDEIVESEAGAARFAGFLIRQQSDKAQALVEEGTAKLSATLPALNAPARGVAKLREPRTPSARPLSGPVVPHRLNHPGSMRKPANLVYGVEEAPPPLVVLITAVQHVGVIAIFMVYPLVIGREFGVATDVLANILRMGMLALAIAVLLQALPHGPVGSRLLAPSSFTGVYLAPSLLAMKIGGLPLLWGMTIFAGLVEIVLSRVWTRLRTFIPSETAGLVVFLIGVNIGLAALRIAAWRCAGPASSRRESAGVAGVALAVMIGLNIWNKGQLRLFCILIGMMVGYVAAVATGLLTFDDFMSVLRQPLFAFPSVTHVSFAFDPALIIPFAVSGLAARWDRPRSSRPISARPMPIGCART